MQTLYSLSTFVLMRAVCLLNLKGGVGKTASAVNLTAAGARRGVRTLLIDLDPQSSATDHLVETIPERNIAEVLMCACSLHDGASPLIDRGDD